MGDAAGLYQQQRPLPALCLSLLEDRVHGKRKGGGLIVEEVTRNALAASNGVATDLVCAQLQEMIDFIQQNLLSSINPDARKGGLLALASIAVGSAGFAEAAPVVAAKVLPTVIPLTADRDPRVRFYSVEALFNSVKIAKCGALKFFTPLFKALCALSADVSPQVRAAASYLDRILKDIAVISIDNGVWASYDNLAMEHLCALFSSSLHVQSHAVVTLTISWTEIVAKAHAASELRFVASLLPTLLTLSRHKTSPSFLAIQSALQTALEDLHHQQTFHQGDPLCLASIAVAAAETLKAGLAPEDAKIPISWISDCLGALHHIHSTDQENLGAEVQDTLKLTGGALLRAILLNWSNAAPGSELSNVCSSTHSKLATLLVSSQLAATLAPSWTDVVLDVLKTRQTAPAPPQTQLRRSTDFNMETGFPRQEDVKTKSGDTLCSGEIRGEEPGPGEESYQIQIDDGRNERDPHWEDHVNSVTTPVSAAAGEDAAAAATPSQAAVAAGVPQMEPWAHATLSVNSGDAWIPTSPCSLNGSGSAALQSNSYLELPTVSPRKIVPTAASAEQRRRGSAAQQRSQLPPLSAYIVPQSESSLHDRPKNDSSVAAGVPERVLEACIDWLCFFICVAEPSTLTNRIPDIMGATIPALAREGVDNKAALRLLVVLGTVLGEEAAQDKKVILSNLVGVVLRANNIRDDSDERLVSETCRKTLWQLLRLLPPNDFLLEFSRSVEVRCSDRVGLRAFAGDIRRSAAWRNLFPSDVVSAAETDSFATENLANQPEPDIPQIVAGDGTSRNQTGGQSHDLSRPLQFAVQDAASGDDSIIVEDANNHRVIYALFLLLISNNECIGLRKSLCALQQLSLLRDLLLSWLSTPPAAIGLALFVGADDLALELIKLCGQATIPPEQLELFVHLIKVFETPALTELRLRLCHTNPHLRRRLHTALTALCLFVPFCSATERLTNRLLLARSLSDQGPSPYCDAVAAAECSAVSLAAPDASVVGNESDQGYIGTKGGSHELRAQKLESFLRDTSRSLCRADFVETS